MGLLTQTPLLFVIGIFIILIQTNEKFDFAFMLVIWGGIIRNDILKLIGLFILLQENINQNFDILGLVLLIILISRQEKPLIPAMILLFIFLGNEEMGLPFYE